MISKINLYSILVLIALFFAGSELAVVVKDIGNKKSGFYVMLIIEVFAMWNLGAAFLAGVILDSPLRKSWLKIRKTTRSPVNGRPHRIYIRKCWIPLKGQ